MFVGCVKNCFRNIGERPTEIRRKAGGDSPKSQRRFAERTTEIRRKAERMKTTNHHPVRRDSLHGRPNPRKQKKEYRCQGYFFTKNALSSHNT